MSSSKQKKRRGEAHLQRIIDLCRSVEEREVNPFLVDIKDVINIVREYFPEWDSMDEYSLDAEAVNRLASVIKLQSDWVRHRSTSLYTDPFLLEEKMRKLSRETLARIFLGAWHPIVELEQISPNSLAAAFKYWQNLLPLNERWQEIASLKTEVGETTREELIRQRIVAENAFSQELETFWLELKRRAGVGGKVDYWNFVGADTYEKTVSRAYMTSFLVTYGYATLEIHRLEEEVFIKPYEEPIPMLGSRQAVSIPISVSVEEWKRWRENRGE